MPDLTSDVQDQPEMEETHTTSPNLPITELGLRSRAKNVLLSAGIHTVSDALTALEGDGALTSLRGFGPKSLADLKERLRERGFSLPGEVAASTAKPRLGKSVEEEIAFAAALLAEEEAMPMETVAPAVAEATEISLPSEAPAPEPTKAVPEAEPADEAPTPPPTKAVPETEPVGETLGQRIRATVAQAREQFRLGAWAYGVIGVLVIAALLFLPPFSLLERFGILGYTTVNAANNSTEHPDGLTLSVDPETFTGKLRVRLDSVPQLEFLEGSAGAALREAVEALPDHFAVKSPFYQIRVRGNPDRPVMLDVAVPNNAEPWETLDLYTWTGETWEWVGSELHAEMAEHEFVRAQVTDTPANLVVVQAGQIAPTVSASLGPSDNPVTAASVLDEINPTGLLLGTDGDLIGDPASLPQPAEGATYAVLPTLRNWAAGATVNRGLLSDLLTIPEIQEAHIANIVQLCTERGFAGVNVDYRGVAPTDRDAYTAFIRALADGLHAEGLRLTIAVESPTPVGNTWDTGGYDWAKLGTIAGAVQVPFPADPDAYTDLGEARRLLNWATSQIPRHNLRMLVSSLSVERNGEAIKPIPLAQALAPFGEPIAIDGVSQVKSGEQVRLGFSGQVLSITPQETAGTYRLEYEASDGETHTVWLGTAANLTAKLDWAQRYHLGGIVVSDMLAPGNAAGILEAVAAYHSTAAPPAGQGIDVVWTVTSAEAMLDQQISPLTEPGYTWMVTAADGTYNVNATIGGYDHGSVPIAVGEPEPEAAEHVATTEASTATVRGAGGGGAADACLDAQYVADVTVPDNTQLDNGEAFVKTWRVRNTGTCAWPEDTVLAFADGEQMGAPESVAVGAVEPGAEVEVSVDMEAPAKANRYTGIWRMMTAEGLFGGNLTVVIQAGEVTSPLPTAPISSGSFELGGHIRDGAYPYSERMHYAGMTWSKVQVHYGQDASGIIAAAHANGFKIQLSALSSPDMVTQSGFEQSFANWVAGMAAAGADAIEVWNEPNIDREWQIGYISPQAYTNLLCTSYQAIKAANSGTAVISAAPAPTGWFGGCGPNGCDDAPWMAGLRDAGAAGCMDYIGAHHNAGATSPSARIGHPANPSDTHHSWFFLPQTELYYNTFGGARKLFYTEMGYASQEGVPTFSDAFGWARGTNNAQQAAWLAEAVQLSINTGMVRCIIVWNIDFTRYGADPQDGYAIIRPGGSCPACETLHALLGTR